MGCVGVAQSQSDSDPKSCPLKRKESRSGSEPNLFCLCCCVCVTSFQRQLTPLFVDSEFLLLTSLVPQRCTKAAHGVKAYLPDLLAL